MNPEIQLSVIVPCYNPPNGWLQKLNAAILEIENKIPSVEFVLVNDGTNQTDLTVAFEQVKTSLPLVSVSYTKNKGKGYALRRGVQAAHAEWIIYTDIDFPYNTESFLQIFSALKNGADVAMGVRHQPYYEQLPKTRMLISKLLRWLVQRLFDIHTNDTQCGLKGFNTRGKTIFLNTTIYRYLFDLEFIYLATKNNLKIVTVPVELKPGIVFTKMKWSILFHESLSLIKIFLRSLKNRY